MKGSTSRRRHRHRESDVHRAPQNAAAEDALPNRVVPPSKLRRSILWKPRRGSLVPGQAADEPPLWREAGSLRGGGRCKVRDRLHHPRTTRDTPSLLVAARSFPEYGIREVLRMSDIVDAARSKRSQSSRYAYAKYRLLLRLLFLPRAATVSLPGRNQVPLVQFD